MSSDIDIARNASLQPIVDVAARLGIPPDVPELRGRYIAKIPLTYCDDLRKRPPGKLILVTAITPTAAGEGKTTTSIGLADGLRRIGRSSIVCLREPSMGPCFGMKGGATGGGYSQVVPMEEINLHFTGDFHAIGSAHNLLAAMVDNHIHQSNTAGFDLRRPMWGRVLDMNDRSLRQIVCGLGGVSNGIPHESRFEITVASEVMAVFCLSGTIRELRRRLGDMIVGYTRDRRPITASRLKANGAMSVLLKDALRPNLVQTLEHTPALVHGGPFANIAHGCNSLIATQTALRLADYTVTEAGFGADLGAEKFFNIKCRRSGLRPDGVVLVATIRALKMHGGIPKDRLTEPDVGALRSGMANLGKQIENVRKFGLPVVVALNTFPTDTEEELRFAEDYASGYGVRAIRATHWADGGAGAEDLAHAVVEMVSRPAEFRLLYPDEMSLFEKVRTVCREIYGAEDAIMERPVAEKFRYVESLGFGHFPICMAKTQYSFSTDPDRKGRPEGFRIFIRDVRACAGAGFLVVFAGNVMTMPGLPGTPAAESID
ncbi:MAG: formate--tetrahydrofolate ligase, partial [Planctomycetia bacterium]|nr:formate--tetrahydrofolate ligase [Planctomycetia bacterium]